MRFRFSIRDLLWLTALVAMGVAWWVNRHRLVTAHSDYQGKLWTIIESGAGFGPWNVRDRNGFSDSNIDLIYSEALQNIEAQQRATAQPAPK